MKIICGPLGPRYQSLIPAFKEVMPDMMIWGGTKHINPYDLFDQCTPDILLVDQQIAVQPAFMDALRPKASIKIITFGNNPISFCQPAATVMEPSIDDERKKRLVRCNPVYLKSFADVVGYWGGEKSDKKYDIGLVTNHLECSKIDSIKILLEISAKFKLAAAGLVRLPIPQYLGAFTDTNKELSFLKSCKMALDFGNNNILNQVANGILTISDTPHQLAKPISFIEEYLKSPTNDFINEAQKKVLTSSTSYHRVKEILEAAEIHDYTETINLKIEELCN